MDDRTKARFMSRVEVQPNGCWRWKGKPNKQGYGYFWFEGKSRLAHRFSYLHFVGPIPEGYDVEHVCHSRDTTCAGGEGDPHRLCVNPSPEHLEAVTAWENVMRGRGLAAANAAKTVCDHGHSFTRENTYVYPNGERGCRTCRVKAHREWREKFRPKKGRPAPATHCPQQHEMTQENTYVDPRGGRTCRLCQRTRLREAQRARRAALKVAKTAS